MVDLIFIGLIIVIGILILEIGKHVFAKTVFKFIVIIVVCLIVFLAVVNSLGQNIKTDNEFIKTGAAIADTIEEQPLTYEIKEKVKELFETLKDKLSNRD